MAAMMGGAGGQPSVEQLQQMIGNMAGKLVEEELRAEEAHVDDVMNKLDNMDDDDMEKLRQARKRRMQAEAQKKVQLRAQGHGEYREISGAKDFFAEVKNAPACAVHFYRPATARCVIFDKHMSRCCKKYIECKFIKINAEKEPFLCEKLHIWCLPSIVLIKDGKTLHTCVGFNDFGGDDDFSDEMFEYVLGQHDVLKYRGSPPEEAGAGSRRKAQITLNRETNMSIRQKEYSDSDSD